VLQMLSTRPAVLSAADRTGDACLLLTRQGVPVTLLEGHGDFSREFRGDGIVPSTLGVLDELVLLERVFEPPHSLHETIALRTAKGSIPLVDFGRVKTPPVLRASLSSALARAAGQGSRRVRMHPRGHRRACGAADGGAWRDRGRSLS
jgi:2-polyprenyl-6-methoxyphenol hydroxylase-like FAD-dependent oxidoreductase